MNIHKFYANSRSNKKAAALFREISSFIFFIFFGAQHKKCGHIFVLFGTLEHTHISHIQTTTRCEKRETLSMSGGGVLE